MIKLIVGLGNPGPQYVKTRHNVGAWFVNALAEQSDVVLRAETKFHGMFATTQLHGTECKLLLPTTFMNCSGQAVSAVANFYKISPAAILVAHDDLDFATGIVKLKYDGGTGGHNGLTDIVKALDSNQFWRLRFGIGRPQTQNKDVVNYVLGTPSTTEAAQITQAINKALAAIADLLRGDTEKAIRDVNASA